MVITTREPIDPRETYDRIAKGGAGSVVLHYAVVKKNNDPGRSTACIDYRADGDVEGELAGIADELKASWNLEDVLLVRRTGCLKVGDIISLVAASSPNSSDAFEACQHGISRMKRMATIRKQEIYG